MRGCPLEQVLCCASLLRGAWRLHLAAYTCSLWEQHPSRAPGLGGRFVFSRLRGFFICQSRCRNYLEKKSAQQPSSSLPDVWPLLIALHCYVRTTTLCEFPIVISDWMLVPVHPFPLQGATSSVAEINTAVARWGPSQERQVVQRWKWLTPTFHITLHTSSLQMFTDLGLLPLHQQQVMQWSGMTITTAACLQFPEC